MRKHTLFRFRLGWLKHVLWRLRRLAPNQSKRTRLNNNILFSLLINSALADFLINIQ